MLGEVAVGEKDHRGTVLHRGAVFQDQRPAGVEELLAGLDPAERLAALARGAEPQQLVAVLFHDGPGIAGDPRELLPAGHLTQVRARFLLLPVLAQKDGAGVGPGLFLCEGGGRRGHGNEDKRQQTGETHHRKTPKRVKQNR